MVRPHTQRIVLEARYQQIQTENSRGARHIGVVDDLKDHIERTKAQEILTAVASVNSSQMKRFVDLCHSTLLPFKVVPRFWRNH